MQPIEPIQVGILGPLTVCRAAEPLTVAGSRLRRLLLRLAVDAGSTVSASELLDAVWPEDETRPDGATNALQSLVSRLRRALGDATLIQQLPGGYRLAISRTDVDAHQFGRLAAQGRAELRTGSAETALIALDSALSLWQGNPLADADGAAYADSVIAGLNEQRTQAMSDLFDAHIKLGRAADVVAQLEELATADLLQEAFAAQLMTALAAAGRTADALAAYERLRERLADELGVDPGPRLQAMHLALLRGEMPTGAPTPAPPAATEPSARLTNIRASLTSFIGRDAELHRICELLDAGRLTTIIGPGGAGKTRLSAEAASVWLQRAADGVWMVELAPVTEAANIPHAVLSALGLRDARVVDRRTERAARDSVERLFESLQDADTLLVIDNCEHLIGPVAELADAILARCRGVRILATSREPLGIVGESLCVIPPLGLPPIATTAAEAATYPAVQLLTERAAAVSAGFRVDDTTVRDVVEIVRRLDGLPLAIELAAARVRVLPVAEIAARLGDRFRLLTGGNRAAMPRHRTLRAVVEWSWDLLTPAERLLAERLSVFPAGATEEAAIEICADELLAEQEVPDLLISLVDKSLLQVVDDSGLRYRMLETIREYGIERLAERSEATAARAAHARYFSALAGRLDPVLRTDEQLSAIATLNAEQGNLVAALRFLGDSGDLDSAMGMAMALLWHWSMSGSHNEIITWTAFLLDLPGASDHELDVYVRAARALSELSSDHEDLRGGKEMVQRFAALAEELEAAPPPKWPALVVLAPILSFFSGEDKRAIRLSEVLEQSDDPWIRAATRTMRAAFAENQGDLDSMRVDVDAALADFETLGDRWGMSTTLNSRAWVRTLDGDPRGAILDYQRALGYLGELGGDEDDLLVHIRLAGLYLRLGDRDAARASLSAARREDAGTGAHGIIRHLLADGLEAFLLLLDGDTDGASAMCRQLRAKIRAQSQSPWMRGHMTALTLSATAGLDLRLGNIEQVAIDVEIAFPMAVETRDLPIVSVVGVSIAGLALARGNTWQSAHMLGASARLRGGDDFTDPAVAWLVDQLRPALGPVFDDAYGEGRLLSIDAALAVLDPTASGAGG